MAGADETPRLSKQERRERAREEARRLREEKARREKRNRRLMIGGTIALMAIMAVVVTLVVLNSGKSALEGVASPDGSDEHGGIPVSSSLVAGEPGEGVRVNIYSDYTCSWCEVFELLHAQQIEEFSGSGEAQFWIHPVATLDGSGDFSGYSGLAVNASATVAQHAPEQWLAFHAALFTPYSDAVERAQTEENVPAPGLPEIESAAASVGVPAEVIARFADGEFREWTEATTRDFIRLRDQAATPEIQVAGEMLTDWTVENALRDAIAAAAE